MPSDDADSPDVDSAESRGAAITSPAFETQSAFFAAFPVLAPAVPKVDLVFANQRFMRVFDTDPPESASPSLALFLPAR